MAIINPQAAPAFAMVVCATTRTVTIPGPERQVTLLRENATVSTVIALGICGKLGVELTTL